MVLLILRRRTIFAALAVMILAAVWLWPKGDVAASASVGGEEMVVIVDAGHGGSDGGAVSPSGVAESGLNLAIALKLAGVLDVFGQPVVLTRTGESSLADDTTASLRQQKVSDTRNRVSLVNEYPHGVLLSIHQNTLPGHPTVQGAQSFHNGREGAEPLAAAIQQTLNETVNAAAKSPRTTGDDVYLMKHAQCPAVLVECGFLSHPAEVERLGQREHQLCLATAITAGYLQFLHE